MDRREFLRKSFLYGLSGSLIASVSGFGTRLFGHGRTLPDLVALRGSDPVTMFKRGIEEIGGMGRFVKRGQTVVVKPNIGWDVSPERAANTNPDLVKAVVESCYAAGARRVLSFDNTCDNWRRSYQNSGIEDAVRAANGQMVPGNLERYYHPVDIPGARRLKDVKVHELILESDLYINVPVLKHHGSTSLTIAMKNLMGIIWDRRFWHRNNLHQCIADFCLYERKPQLNIVDAYFVMTRNGPRGVSTADLTRMESLLISPDIVAIDAASTLLFGSNPKDIGYLRIAEEMGIGTLDLSKLDIERVYF